MKRLYQETFYFHFQNLKYVSGRNTTFLCYRVDKAERHGTVLLDRGIFTRQFNSPCPESHFLSWFHENFPCHDENFQVTWYLSWSPRHEHAEEVADFLAAHRNVRLTILTARLYYFWDPEFQEGLRRMYEEGARVAIMSPKDFENCWKDFVFNEGRDFRPWENMVENYQLLRITLQEILRPLMSPEDFRFEYENLQLAVGRHKTYMCYLLERQKGATFMLLDAGVFQNQALEHAERRFLSSPDILQLLDGGRHYRVTWYLSWSPCSQCARAVAGFLAQHGNVSLRIFVARLYNHEDPENRQGLRTLNSTGTPIRVMTNREFALCWERFVRHQGAAFEPWAGLRENADLLLGQLEDILGV